MQRNARGLAPNHFWHCSSGPARPVLPRCSRVEGFEAVWCPRESSLEDGDESRWDKIRVDDRERPAVDLVRLTHCIVSANEEKLIRCSLPTTGQFPIAIDTCSDRATNVQLRPVPIFPL